MQNGVSSPLKIKISCTGFAKFRFFSKESSSNGLMICDGLIGSDLDIFVCLLKLIGCLNLITNGLSFVLHLSLDQHKYVKPLKVT
jgi:hypothetical protein